MADGRAEDDSDSGAEGQTDVASRRRTRRRRRGSSSGEVEDAPGVVTRVREVRATRDEVVGVRGSTRLEAKKQRRREGREAGRRRQVITEAEFLSAVEMATRARYGPGPLTRFAADLVIPDDVRAECSLLKAVAAHYVMFTDERRSVMGRQEEVVRTLVEGYRRHPERLDADLAADFAGAADDAARLRVVLDQIASLTDARAVTLARTHA